MAKQSSVAAPADHSCVAGDRREPSDRDNAFPAMHRPVSAAADSGSTEAPDRLRLYAPCQLREAAVRLRLLRSPATQTRASQ